MIHRRVVVHSFVPPFAVLISVCLHLRQYYLPSCGVFLSLLVRVIHSLTVRIILYRITETRENISTMMNTKSTLFRASMVGIVFAAQHARAFVSPARCSNNGVGPLFSEPEKIGRMERVEYKIFPDGRVEEKVVGVKGESCLEITREINEKLGNVISTTPTEEMFEEEIKIEQTLMNSNTEGDGSSWEGSSSW